MENILTFDQIMKLFLETREQMQQQSVIFNQNLDRERKEREQSRKEFDKRLGELTGTWGKFVAEMVKPKIVDLFKEKGIQIRTSMQHVEGYIDDERHYEIIQRIIKETRYSKNFSDFL